MTGYQELQEGTDKERWNKEQANFTNAEAGDGRGEMLIIDGHPVMSQWEQPYMAQLASVATRNGGRVLEVGFGLGLSATAIQATSSTSTLSSKRTQESSSVAKSGPRHNLTR